jgi:hypothetical protein
MINLGTQQLGNKLVRTFETGKGIRRAVTEVVDGKTFTHIFDSNGEPVVSRVKTFATEQVGDKTVRTIDKFIHKESLSSSTFATIRKTVDNVYRDKKFLGSRKTLNARDGSLFVIKKSANDPVIQGKSYNKDGKLCYRSEENSTGNVIAFNLANDLGLPIPKGEDKDLELYNKLSLRRMRDSFFRYNPQGMYTDSKRLVHLNKVDAPVILSSINDKIAGLTNKLNSMLNK